MTICRILEGVRSKTRQAAILFVDFTKAFDTIHREKMEQIVLTYSLPKETVAAIIMLYRNTNVKVCSPDGDTDYFDIVAGDTLAPFIFIICLDYGGCPRGVMVKAMNCGIVVREFVLQSRYYVHFRANTIGKGMNPLILPPAMGK